MYDYSFLLNKFGGISTTQVIFLIYFSYGNMWGGYVNVLPVFAAYTPEKRCKVPPLDNASLYPTLTREDILNYTTPLRADQGNYDTCFRYGYNLTLCNGHDLSCVNTSYPKIPCDHGYEWETSVMRTSTVSEYDLVCSRLMLNSVSNAIFYVGMFFGGLISGNLADNVGRQKCIVLGLIVFIGCLVGNAYSVNLEMYIAFRMLYAIGYNTQAIGYIVYMNEQFTNERRTIFNGIVNAGKVVGIMLTSAVAYYFRTWRETTLVCAIGCAPFLLMTLYIGESPRWLISEGKTQKAVDRINFMAKINRKEITTADWDDARELWEKSQKQTSLNLESTKKTSIDLFKNSTMRILVLLLMFNWFCCSFIYFGISINAGALAGNVFINNFLNGVMELVAFFILAFTLDRFGRRRILICSHFLAGLGLLASMLVTSFSNQQNSDMITIGKVFAFLAKAGSSSAFAIVYQITNELFPTCLRSNGLGACSMVARAGGIIAMFLIDLQAVYKWLPNTFFGIFGILAGLSTFFIPETNGLELPESIDDAVHLYKNWKTMSKPQDKSS